MALVHLPEEYARTIPTIAKVHILLANAVAHQLVNAVPNEEAAEQ